jgi:hypothetical protein
MSLVDICTNGKGGYGEVRGVRVDSELLATLLSAIGG